MQKCSQGDMSPFKIVSQHHSITMLQNNERATETQTHIQALAEVSRNAFLFEVETDDHCRIQLQSPLVLKHGREIQRDIKITGVR